MEETTTGPVREFVLQWERGLRARRLYEPGSPPHLEATAKLYEKLQEALQPGEFALRFTPTEILIGKASLIKREQKDEAFFFPLYRDGLRELRFLPEASLEELNHLIGVLEADSLGMISASEDTITYLWRGDLEGITFKALDGLGDEEMEEGAEEAGDDYLAMVGDLMAKIKDPAPAETGQTYAFIVDADVKIAQSDFEYDATTLHRSFEENPTVLRLSPQEAERLRGEAGELDEGDLLQRFISILFVFFADPSRPVAMERAAPVFSRIMEGFWQTGQMADLCQILKRLVVASQKAPLPESRVGARQIHDRFLTPERFTASLEMLERGDVPADEALAFWALYPDTDTWDELVSFLSCLKGEQAGAVANYLRHRLKADPDLVRSTLAAEDPVIIRVGLELLGEQLDPRYEDEVLALAGHRDESIRQRGVAAACLFHSDKALQTLLHAMESDPSQSVRLRAFRAAESSRSPQLAPSLKTIVSKEDFSSRPLWERKKYVHLLGRLGRASVVDLFTAWIPDKRWLWKQKDDEATELALLGLTACGKEGISVILQLSNGKGRAAEMAYDVIEELRSKKRRRDQAAAATTSDEARQQ